MMIESGVQVFFGLWRLDVNTFEECFLERTKRWVHVYGLPYHLWSSGNFMLIGNQVGEAVAVDPCSINFTKHDAVRIKVRSEQSLFNFDPIWVFDGVKS